MSRKLDLTGLTYNSLMVLEECSGPTARIHWSCKCICGNIVVVASNNLRNGHTKSCGCLKSETWTNTITTHGMAGCPEHTLWKGMMNRCYNPNSKSYDRYGGRGVYVVPEWHEFEKFYADVGTRPSPEFQMERKDNSGPYGPHNFKWATRVEQCNNRRSNRVLNLYGETVTLAQAARKYGVLAATIRARIERGWSHEQAVVKLTQEGQR